MGINPFNKEGNMGDAAILSDIGQMIKILVKLPRSYRGNTERWLPLATGPRCRSCRPILAPLLLSRRDAIVLGNSSPHPGFRIPALLLGPGHPSSPHPVS